MGRKTEEVNSKEILYLQGDSISMKGYLGPSMGPVPDRAHWGLLSVPIQTNLWDHLNQRVLARCHSPQRLRLP